MAAPRRRRNLGPADLGIDVASGREGEQFKWFLASVLFGRPIQQTVARRTYQEFVREGLTTPQAALGAGWDRLVEVLDRGHYVRYDFSTATRLLDICRMLLDRYGSLAALLARPEDEGDLRRRLLEFPGIGPVTARIFLRGSRRAGAGPAGPRAVDDIRGSSS